MEINLDGDDVALEQRLHGLCRDLLSNPVIEDYELQKTEVRDHKSEMKTEEPKTRKRK
jgi:phosphoribosylformylglycinamidine (FGAM) synthase PurS component